MKTLAKTLLVIALLAPQAHAAFLVDVSSGEYRKRVHNRNHRRAELMQAAAVGAANAVVEAIFAPTEARLEEAQRQAAASNQLNDLQFAREALRKLREMKAREFAANENKYAETPLHWGRALETRIAECSERFVTHIIEARNHRQPESEWSFRTAPGSGFNAEALFPLLRASRAYRDALFLAYKAKNPTHQEAINSATHSAQAKRSLRVSQAAAFAIMVTAALGAHYGVSYLWPDMGFWPHAGLDVIGFLVLQGVEASIFNRVIRGDWALIRSQVTSAVKSMETHFFANTRDLLPADFQGVVGQGRRTAVFEQSMPASLGRIQAALPAVTQQQICAANLSTAERNPELQTLQVKY